MTWQERAPALVVPVPLPVPTIGEYPSGSAAKPLSTRAVHREPTLGRSELSLRLCTHGELRSEEGGEGEWHGGRAERLQQDAGGGRDCRGSDDHAADCAQAHAASLEHDPDGSAGGTTSHRRR